MNASGTSRLSEPFSELQFQKAPELSFQWAWCGRVPYPEAWALQKECVQARMEGGIMDTLLFLEHPHVYTLGRAATPSDILFSAAECKIRGIAVEQTDRGGKVTYHGPGQLVGYMIFDLRARSWSVPRFVSWVEESICRYSRAQGLDPILRKNKPGVWVQGKKLASLGFHIHRGVSCHGFALNVAPDVSLFKGIIPCGAPGDATSLQDQGCPVKPLRETADLLASFFL